MRWLCVFGAVQVRERIWRDADRSYIRLLPERLGVAPRGKSKRLQRVMTDFGCEQSFAKASGRVKEHYGFEIGPTAVRLTTLVHARRARTHLGGSYEKPFRLLPEKGEEQIIAEADGTMICTVRPGSRKQPRPREWKEMRLAAARGRDRADAVYAAGFADVDTLGRMWGHCAKEAGRGQNSRVHAVGDGAEWIRLQTTEVFGEEATFLCDFYHVGGYLAKAAPTCRPDKAESWRRTQQRRMKRGQAAKVVGELALKLEPEGTPELEAPVRSAHRYLSNRMDCLDYPGALDRDLPIGSGMIESGHKHVLHARLKIAGAAWLADNANHLAHLRVMRANQKWDQFWN